MSIHHLAGQMNLPLPDSPSLVCQRTDPPAHRSAFRKDAPGRIFCERCGEELTDDPSWQKDTLK